MQPLALAKLSERNPERVAQQGEVEDLSLFIVIFHEIDLDHHD